MDDVAKKYDAYAYEPSGKLTVDVVIDHLRNVTEQGLKTKALRRPSKIPFHC